MLGPERMGKRSLVGYLTYTLVVALVGCGRRQEQTVGVRVALQPTYSALEALVFHPKCVSCHSGPDAAAGIDLSGYLAIVRSKAVPPLVVKTKPDESRLYRSLVHPEPHRRMPKDGVPLSEAEILAVRLWIDRGARYHDKPPRG